MRCRTPASCPPLVVIQEVRLATRPQDLSRTLLSARDIPCLAWSSEKCQRPGSLGPGQSRPHGTYTYRSTSTPGILHLYTSLMNQSTESLRSGEPETTPVQCRLRKYKARMEIRYAGTCRYRENLRISIRLSGCTTCTLRETPLNYKGLVEGQETLFERLKIATHATGTAYLLKVFEYSRKRALSH